ncbi:hypothetical protein D3C80_1730030 [compost metagenome]
MRQEVALQQIEWCKSETPVVHCHKDLVTVLFARHANLKQVNPLNYVVDEPCEDVSLYVVGDQSVDLAEAPVQILCAFGHIGDALDSLVKIAAI